ncbi:MAG: hypothetical protein PHC66_01360 [Candidatus Nanoarchaeia archaeon]|nr:hypothetical protein [Candidatus Nanoarchaeia archaeon]MDD5239141.1 hypothetical protein [Candidatus Nanoarchaeia archaeon]
MLDYLFNLLPFPEVSGKLKSRIKEDKSLRINDFYYSFLEGLFLIGVKDKTGKKSHIEVQRCFPLWEVHISGNENSRAYQRIDEIVDTVCAGRACFQVYKNGIYCGAIPYSQKEIRKPSKYTA